MGEGAGQREGKETAMVVEMSWGKKKLRGSGCSREIIGDEEEEERMTMEERKRKGKEPETEGSDKMEKVAEILLRMPNWISHGALLEPRGRDIAQGQRPMSRSPSPPAPAPAPRQTPPVDAVEDWLVRLQATGQIAKCCRPFEKKLTGSDSNRAQARLIIVKKDVEGYIRPVLGEPVGSTFQFYDGEDREYKLTYKRWGGGTMIFNGQWNLFMKDNELEVGDSVRIWAFEYSTPGKFGGVILPIKKPCQVA